MTKILLFLTFIFVSEPCIAGTLRGQRSDQRKEEGRTKRLSDFFFDSAFHSVASSIQRKEKRRKTSSIPTKCLEDPDDPDCEYDKLVDVRDLKNYAYYYYDEKVDKYYSRPKDNERVMYVQYPATSSPTRDMCYGNMEKFQHGKFCHSEMPSVSQEPSDQPTTFPIVPDGDNSSDSPSDVPSSIPTTLFLTTTGIPTALPSSIQPTITTSSTKVPTITPSISPVFVVTPSPVVADADDDDDDTHHEDPDDTNPPTKRPTTMRPTRQPSPLPTYQEDDCPASFSTTTTITAAKSDTVRFTLAVDHPDRPTSPQAFRLRLYWEEGYYWQEEDFERTWCLRCEDNFNCNKGEKLYLGYCGSWTKSSYFEFLPVLGNKVLISMIRHDSTPLCLERKNHHVVMEPCDESNDYQKWNVGTSDVRRFEIFQSVNGIDWCVSNHHHPKCGEMVEIFPCSQVREWSTSYWNKY